MIGSPFSIEGIGVITINSDGSFTFIPDPNYIGDLPPINYTAKTSDGSKSASACLHISVLNGFSETSNNDPIAINDVYTVEIGETAVVNILANDSDPDGDIISLVGVSGLDASGNSIPISTNSASPTAVYDANGVYAGTAYIDANDNIVFVPDNSYIGNVPFNYTISDGNGGSDSAIAVISVVPNNGSNSDIYANDDSKIVLQGTTITGDVSENDIWGGTNPEITTAHVNIDGIDYTFVIGTPTTIPNVGQITINADGTYTFIPEPDFVGTVGVIYTVENNEGNSATATLNLTTIPIIAEPSYTITKTASAGTYVLGDNILYTIVVENTGNVTLTNLVVADNDPSATIVSGDFNIGTLLKGATYTIVVSHTVTQADIDNASFTNIVTLNGKAPNGTSLTESSDSETVTFTQNPSIALVKTVTNTGTGDAGKFILGDDIEYTFVIS
ncbi:MAG: cadherin-like domain-containing protein, partial [Bacteroidales bacterium]|nr:cadherin-like domain-containing protein [Bacteroidales bacterium]